MHADAAPSPFRPESILLRLGIIALPVEAVERNAWNQTFLVDISGSMTDRLSSVKQMLYVLLDQMREGDQISSTTFAGGVPTPMEPVGFEGRELARAMIGDLKAHGSTAMGSGIENAYRVNRLGFLQGGENRISVCSDGDANVGDVSHESILGKIAAYREQRIGLSTLGFGTGNYNALMMEQLADKGDGNYHYIDSEAEMRKLTEIGGVTLLRTLARNVKVLVAFEPEAAEAYRLLGYENRAINDERFRDPEQDGGEVGPEHEVTALFELRLKPDAGEDWGSVSIRYSLPERDGETEKSLGFGRKAAKKSAEEAVEGWRRAAAAAELAEQFRRSPLVSPEHLSLALQLLQREAGLDSGGGEELKDTARLAVAALSLR